MITHKQDGSKRHTERVSHVQRLFDILYQLQFRAQGESVTLESLAETCSCSSTTIKRDIHLLRSRFDIRYDPKQRTYSLTNSIIPNFASVLSEVDLRTLTLARTLLTLPGMPQVERIRAVFDKIFADATEKQRDQMHLSESGVLADALPRNYARTPLNLVLAAIQKRRSLEIDYDSINSRARAWRSVDPYAVEPRDGVYWELHAWCHKNREFRTFALDRIFEARLKTVSFTYRAFEWEQFQTQENIGGMRGQQHMPVAVHVLFAQDVATSVRHVSWTSSVTFKNEAQGEVTMIGTVPGGKAMSRLVSMILSFRRHAVVLGGPELVAAVRDELAAIEKLYMKSVQEAEVGHEC